MNIKSVRETMGLSQREFADKFHFPVRTVQNWELRECCPSYIIELLIELEKKQAVIDNLSRELAIYKSTITS